MIYDKKEDIKFSKEITFPFTATNFSRVTKECKDKEELLNHIICRTELKSITQILSAKVHPEVFIENDTYTLISEFIRFKRYGIDFLYGDINNIPSLVLQSFDLIQNILDADEISKIKQIKEKK